MQIEFMKINLPRRFLNSYFHNSKVTSIWRVLFSYLLKHSGIQMTRGTEVNSSSKRQRDKNMPFN